MKTKYIVDNLSGQTINGEYVLPIYKVFKALVTQNGGYNLKGYTYGSGPENPSGITFEIYNNDGGTADFTNIGAPDNEIGTKFVSIGGNPNSWGVNMVGELTYDQGAPVVTVLEDTIGGIWFQRNGAGEYQVFFSSLFVIDKTIVILDSFGQNGNLGTKITHQALGKQPNFIITTYKHGLEDSILYKNTLEIRIYN